MNSKEIDVLLVEDSMEDAEMTLQALNANGFNITLLHVEDGVQALDFLFGKGAFTGRDTALKPKLILLDLKMPRMDGIELLKIIKVDNLTKRIPVVILTSSKEDPDIDKCYSLGANSYIVKPVEFDDFIKTVSEIGLYWNELNQPPH